MRTINEVLLQISKRAESHEPKYIVDSFVNSGSLIPLLTTRDHQIILGRRGTGKTHLLGYLEKTMATNKRIAIQIDMRTMGSTGGIYAAKEIPIAERGTRLLVDTLVAIHDKLYEVIVNRSEELNLNKLGGLLDAFGQSATTVVIEGKFEQSATASMNAATSRGAGVSGELSKAGPLLKVSLSEAEKSGHSAESKERREGREVHRVIFGSVQRDLQNIISALPSSQLWILLDEWSEVPMDLQPYLADLIRRTIMSTKGAVVKIAAIEQRSKFRLSNDDSGYIGIEVGADASSSINLDEFMVFDNNKDLAKEFFSELLFRHAKSISHQNAANQIPSKLIDFIGQVFTQTPVVEEFVKASEGVPRDAINIIGIAAQLNPNDKISMPDIRRAARNWYTRNKAASISSRQEAQDLLNWIIESVIKHRKARAFLLQNDIKDALIDYLYDSRVLHIIKTGVSSNDSPGKRYTVYAIDYGCYVDLINTANEPAGLFQIEPEDDENSGIDTPEYTEVPQTDYRSIRRAILNLDEFYARKYQTTFQLT